MANQRDMKILQDAWARAEKKSSRDEFFALGQSPNRNHSLASEPISETRDHDPSETFDQLMKRLGVLTTVVPMLKSSELEVLRFVHRALVQGRGFGTRDSRRGYRIGIPLKPQELAKNGCHRQVTYKRAIAALHRVKLLIKVGKDGKFRLSAPCWWGQYESNPRKAIDAATARLMTERPHDHLKRP